MNDHEYDEYVQSRMEALEDAYEDDEHGRCDECGGVTERRRYLYGDDADGNRGEWRYGWSCVECGEEWD